MLGQDPAVSTMLAGGAGSAGSNLLSGSILWLGFSSLPVLYDYHIK